MSALKHGDENSIISQKSTESHLKDPESIQSFGLEKLDVKFLEKGKDKVKLLGFLFSEKKYI